MVWDIRAGYSHNDIRSTEKSKIHLKPLIGEKRNLVPFVIAHVCNDMAFCTSADGRKEDRCNSLSNDMQQSKDINSNRGLKAQDIQQSMVGTGKERGDENAKNKICNENEMRNSDSARTENSANLLDDCQQYEEEALAPATDRATAPCFPEAPFVQDSRNAKPRRASAFQNWHDFEDAMAQITGGIATDGITNGAPNALKSSTPSPDAHASLLDRKDLAAREVFRSFTSFHLQGSKRHQLQNEKA
ncbi:unnamed protein product [Gongylonema pulchrum]|uniref:INCENP_ARK-bind domain-containing protein n=1 Tax=Gongylonema pulchrum TaxID=637853 RepID=A0A183CYA1_9BILA|nr:unnamed protein product [Gongylonema pulchrum]